MHPWVKAVRFHVSQKEYACGTTVCVICLMAKGEFSVLSPFPQEEREIDFLNSLTVSKRTKKQEGPPGKSPVVPIRI